MSFSAVRPFFRARLQALGFIEHDDVIDFSNIPQTLLSKTFNMESPAATGFSPAQLAHEFNYDITIRVFIRNKKRGSIEAHDQADILIDQIYSEILSPENRNGTALKDIIPLSVNKEAYSGSDDNDVLIEFNFSILLVNCYA